VRPSSSNGLIGSLVAQRYQVLSKLGQGGMGAVYVAEQRPLQRRVALKVLTRRSDSEARERFIREARAASRLNHPNIATVYDFGTPDTGPFLAMEFIDGATLRELISGETRLEWRRAVGLATQIARGLAAAHREGIVHRDIKPENIVVQKVADEEVVKILDFGLANQIDDASENLTESGVVMGTAAYISPEQLEGVNDDVRSDLYALGVILYEMLAHRHPFAAKTRAAYAIAHAMTKPKPMAEVTPEVPLPICNLVDQLLAKKPGDRPEDGAALVQALDAIMQDKSTGKVSTGLSWLAPVRDHAPDGKVTLVFTDIEGSSSLWDRAPRSMRSALDMHNAVLREALHSAGGYEVKTQGDSFMVAFDDSLRAIQWCLDAQRALAEQPWPDDVCSDPHEQHQTGVNGMPPGLRVRMGVHTGEPDCRRDPVTGRMDYFGPIVNRAARIEGAAHGGQILVGAEVATAVADGLLALHAKTASLGEHRLKGLEDPENLWEIIDTKGLRRKFPPPRALADERLSNLSRDHTSFVGREKEQAEIRSRFSSGSRLLTILGPGGTGKTRLTRVTAQHMLEEPTGPRQVWFCDLSSATDANTVTSQVAGVLSTPLAGGEALDDAIELVGRSLASRGPILLVLDNLEQVIRETPGVVRAWLDLAPELQILATSREAIGIEGEGRLELDPLDLENGALLFAARVKELGRPPVEDEQAVRDLVKALDGMPLAIELAASRIGLLTPAQILERLNRRFEVLRGNRRDVSARQATLRGAIDWSWELLSPAERDAFAQLAIFDGGFAIEAAEEVVDLSAHAGAPLVLDVIQALKDKSLLRTDDALRGEEIRLTMLQSIQEYAREKLEESEASADLLRSRHAQYFAREGRRRARATRSNRGRAAMHWLAGNRQNLLSASEHLSLVSPDLAASTLLALEPLAAERDQTELHRQLLEEAVDLAREAEDEVLLAEGLLYQADLEQEHGDAEEALRLVEEARDALGEDRAPVLRATALVRYGRILYRMGRLKEGTAAFDEAEPIAKAQGAHSLVARILIQRGLLAFGSMEPSKHYFSKALRLARRSGDKNMEARVLGNQGVDLMVRGDLLGADKAMKESLALHRENEARGLEGMVMGNLGAVTLALGQAEESERWLRKAIAIHRELGNELLTGADLANLAGTLTALSRFTDATATAEIAMPLVLATKGAREILICRCNLAVAYACQNRIAEARAVLDEARASPVNYWKAHTVLFDVVDAHILLGEARQEGAPADDPRTEQVRALLEKLTKSKNLLFIPLSTLAVFLDHYPALPPDLSNAE
jgi:serine/threonine protein kinase/predicted ATPase